jgi:hypothetical protein
MTDLNKIVGNFRDILGKLRDILYPQMPNGRVKGSHISITIIMVIKRANPFRGFDSLERTHTRTHAGRQTL